MRCQNCGSERVGFGSWASVETHGLASGPYEHWDDEGYKCQDCGAFDEVELSETGGE